MKIILVLLTLMIFNTSLIKAQWKEISEGLEGGIITSIVKNSRNELFISTYGGGVHYSSDYGENWIPRNDNLFSLITTDIFTNNDTILANTSSNIFCYSFDNGKKWSNSKTNFENNIILSICKDSRFYAITSTEFAVSIDFGLNWLKKGPIITGYKIHKALYQDETFYLLTEIGIYLSKDFGESWILKPFDQVINYIGFFQIIDNIIFYSNGNILYYSKNLGENWVSKQLGQNLLTNLEEFESFYLISSLEGNFKLFKNSDSIEIISGIYYFQHINKSLMIDSMCFFCTSKGLFKTKKNLSHLTSMNRGIKAISSIYLFSDIEDIYIKANSDEIFRKNRYANSWVKMDLDSMVNIKSIVTFRNKSYFIANYRLIVKDTLGNYIETIYFNDDHVIDLLVKDNIIFAVTFNGKLYTSSDNGNNWIQNKFFFENDLRISSLGLIDNHIFVGSSVDKFYYISYDNGESWTKDTTLNNLYFFLKIHTYFFDKNFYTTIGSDYISILTSTDFGKTWFNNYIKNKIPYPGINSLCGTRNFIFVATDKGVFLSTDQGENWLDISAGLHNLNLNDIIIFGDDIYLGTTNGVYTAKLSDFGLSSIEEPQIENDNYLYSFTAYPVPSSNGYIRAMIYWDNKDNIDNAKITITNSNGDIIPTENRITLDKQGPNNGTLNWYCSGEPKGAYFIKIQHGDKSNTLKVIVE